MVDNLALVGFYSFKLNQAKFEKRLRKRQDKPPAYSKVMKHESRYCRPTISLPNVDIPKLACQCDDLVYRGSRKGRCLILNYRQSKQSNNDVSRLRKTFTKLGFEVQSHDQLSYNQTLQVLHRESSRDYSGMNSFFCCILTDEAAKNHIHCRDRKLKITKLINSFGPRECASLEGKPKVFLIEASHQTANSTNVTPTYSDCLLFKCCSSESRYSPMEGVFTHTLCQVFDRYSSQYDLLTLLTITNRFLCTECAPHLACTFTRSLLLANNTDDDHHFDCIF